MLESVIENYDLIREVVIKEEYTLPLMKKAEINIISDMIQILKPFEDATKLISGEIFFLY